MRQNLIGTIVTSGILFFPTVTFAATVPGFKQIENDGGVVLWQKGSEYVHSVSLKDGAQVSLLRGGKYQSKRKQAHFERVALDEWWKEYASSEKNVVSMMNGQFFNPKYPAIAPLAFSTKMRGFVYTGYADKNEFRKQKLLLRIGDDGAIVQRYNDNFRMLQRLPEQDIIVGLDPTVNKAAAVRRRRTFIAVTVEGDVLIFTSPASSQRYATRILQAFGAAKDSILMLDGGGSTQLVHRGRVLIPESSADSGPYLRPVPQAIAIEKG